MSSKNVTVDKILRGKISIIQLKKGFRFGFEAVFLASFVNGYLKKIKKKKKITGRCWFWGGHNQFNNRLSK